MDEEINVILNALDGYSLDYPSGIELDCEENYRTYKLSEHQGQYIDLIKYFCIRIKQSGYIPMIYGKMEWFQQFPEGTFDGYYKWIYSANSEPNDVDNCIIWQYREHTKGIVDGIDEDIYVSINLSAYDGESD